MNNPARRPTFCSIEVLYSCILRCKMCHMWKNTRSSQEMTIREWKKFIVELKEFTGTDISINITGGEPLLKENVLDLARFTVEKGFNAVSMTTNGFLINRTTASAIADSGMNMLSMSLDSLDEKIHDGIRGVQGACRKVMEAFEYFRDYPGKLKKIGVQVIIMGPNLEGILDLTQWAHARKFSIYFMAIVQPLCLSLPFDWYQKPEYGFLWPHEKEKLFGIIDKLIELKENGVDIGNSAAQLKAFKTYFKNPDDFVKKNKQCRMGDGMLKVDAQGHVALCAEKGNIGNVRTDKIENIWFSEKADNVRNAVASCQKNCPQLINCFFEE